MANQLARDLFAAASGIKAFAASLAVYRAQTIFDNIPVVDKKLHWIHGTSARCDGYLEFQRRPEPMLEWFEKHMP